MKTKLMIVCMMSVMCAVGAAQKQSVKKTSLSESELRTLAKAAPDEKSAGKLYSVAMATSDNEERKQGYLKASAAGLIACGKTDVYKKYVKGKLLNVAEFESELEDDCKQCSGSGTKERRCSVCMGKGKCSTCKGSGETVSIGFDGHNEAKQCRKCKGDGHCLKCGGEGSIVEKCLACTGTGRAFSKTVAARVFRDSCNAIADSMEVAAMSKDENAPEGKDSPNERSTEQQNVANNQSQGRGNEEGEPVRTSEALPASYDNNKILGQLNDLKQKRYSLSAVVSAGKAILATPKMPRKAIYGTPFHYHGSGNELELKREVRAIMKSAQALLSDIEANNVAISRGAFNPGDYIEYWHKNVTGIRKRRIFDAVWEKALYSPHLQRDANNNPLGKVLFSKVPDNMVFVVDDVSLTELRGGGSVYCVKVTALVFGKENRTLGKVWNGRECQTERYVELAKKTGLLKGNAVMLLVPTSNGNEDVEKWKKGDMVISKGWLNMWNIIAAVRAYDNGGKEEYRKIEMSGEIVRSLRDWEEMNLNGSL